MNSSFPCVGCVSLWIFFFRFGLKDGHFESVVLCDHRLTFEEAENALRDASGLGESLEKLCVLTSLFEQTALQKGYSFPLEHWEPEVGLELPVKGYLKTRRMVECLSFLVNLYAGQVLDRQSVWREFLSLPITDTLTLPSFVYGRADAQHHRALHRLLQYHPSAAPTQVKTIEVVETLCKILSSDPQSSDVKSERRICN